MSISRSKHEHMACFSGCIGKYAVFVCLLDEIPHICHPYRFPYRLRSGNHIDNEASVSPINTALVLIRFNTHAVNAISHS